MKDFNFFSSFQKKARTSRHKNMLTVVFVLVFIMIIGGVYALFYMEAEDMDAQVAALDQQLNAPELFSEMRQVREDRATFQVVESYYNAVDAVLLDLERGDVINTSFLMLVNQAIPREVVLRNINLAQLSLNLSGAADSRVTIAKFYRNMMDLGVFTEINIGSITEVEVVEEDEDEDEDEDEEVEEQEDVPIVYEYTFSLQCIIKGGEVR